MAIGKNAGAITKLGGGLMYVKKVSNTGGAVAGATWLQMPYMEQSSFKGEGNSEDFKDETGNTVASVETDYGEKFSGIFMQCDKETLDFLSSHGSYSTTGTKGNYFQIIAKRGTVDGKTQEVAFAICKFKRGFDDTTGTRRPPFEITVLQNTSGSPITVTPPTGVFTGSSFSIPNNEYHHIVETP